MYPNQEPQQIAPNPVPNNMEEFNPNLTRPTLIPNFTPNSSPSSSKTGIPKKMIIIGAIIGVAILAMIIIVVISMGKKKDTSTEKPQTFTEQSLVPAPATSLGLQQTNTSIGQDLNSLDNAKDFNTTKLDDKTLGL
ncbi:MAG: hypothetical protein WCP03_00635 [Candidatus Saccharibacteria bacterium]